MPAQRVRRYLREERGARQASKDAYLKLRSEGKSREEAMAGAGVSCRYARMLEAEIRGEKRTYVKAEDRIPMFLEAPEKHKRSPWAGSGSFAQSLNFHCKTLINRDPVGAAHDTGVAIEHFMALLELRKAPRARRLTRCQLVQALANQAARHRALDVPELISADSTPQL